MLKPKLSICLGCGGKRPIWKDGKCKVCASPTRRIKGNSTLKSRSVLKGKRRGKSKEQRDFYRKLTEELMFSAVSIESGKPIYSPSSVNMAHILPKETFPSVATNEDNIVIFTWEEHTRFDELLNRHEFEQLEIEFPNSWGQICELIRKLLPEVTEQNSLKIKLEKYLK